VTRSEGHRRAKLTSALSNTDSYNHYACVPNQSIVESNAKALVDIGLADLGYHYVTTDCGWTVSERTANGSLTWNETLFPDGFPALGDYIHGLGLGFGVYSDSGIQM
jgi:alpha-galactosidase